MLKKGISGGERKRTSIGYELISDPKLILLDEPTSGLDSTTALRIVKLLKREAQSGVTIICTIHQPSSEIFHEFNRLLLMQDGYQIYQGSVAKMKDYLSSQKINMPKFKNPADFIITMVQQPSRVMKSLTK